jgi:hypothetical protein
MQDVQQLKQELLEKIAGIDDYEALTMVKEDLHFWESVNTNNQLGLSSADYDELKELAEEPDEKDTISFEELQQSLRKWRTHS